MRLLPGLLAWLFLALALGFGQHWLWPDQWPLTLLVWWAYLILTVVMLLRLLTLPRSGTPRAATRSLIWTLAAVAVLLWWSRPLWTSVGEDLIRQFKSSPAVVSPNGALASR